MGEKDPAYFRKVLIVGPESSGKTELCAALALHYGGQVVPEFSREYLHTLGRNYVYEDLYEIAKGHAEKEKSFENSEGDFLFIDTEFICLKVWSDYCYQKTDPGIIAYIEKADHDFFLLCEPDLPWEPDPLRENPNDRYDLFEMFKKDLMHFGKVFFIINGTGDERFKKAIEVIDKYLK